MTRRPKAELTVVPFERLTFDPRLQQRAGVGPGGYDEETVREYVTRITDLYAELPPLRAVREGEGPLARLWVYGGFHTAEARRRTGANSAEVLVVPGTFADALLYSLGENGDHGKPRTAADKQKALSTLLDTPTLLSRVVANACDNGGVIRAVAAACQVSKGMVGDALKARGLRVTRVGAIVPADPPAPPPAAEPPTDRRPDRSTSPAPGESVQAANPTAADGGHPPAVPEWVKPALAERERFDKLIANLTACARELDRVSTGPAGTFLRKVLGADGEAFVREVRVKRGQTTTLVYALPPLLSLIRLLKRVRPERVCGGCGGEGCSCCRDTGIIPANLDLLPTAGETGDLFDLTTVGDVWDG